MYFSAHPPAHTGTSCTPRTKTKLTKGTHIFLFFSLSPPPPLPQDNTSLHYAKALKIKKIHTLPIFLTF